jgi:hypothetical protein
MATAEELIALLENGGENSAPEARAAHLGVLARADHVAAAMSRDSSSQTLATSGDLVEFETADYDTLGTIADVANHRFVVPTDGIYEVGLNWQWEGTAPSAGGYVELDVGGVAGAPLVRGLVDTAFGGKLAIWQVALSASDLVTFIINTTTSGVTVRGTAAVTTRSVAWIRRGAVT